MNKGGNILIAFLLISSVISIAKADSLIVNPHLACDPAIASMTAQVDTLSLKYYMEGLQSFFNHSIFRTNHDSTALWLRDQFLATGISDVKLDSFYHPLANKYGYNIVATIPGLNDTSIVYIAGGHWDAGGSINLNGDTSYSPGADDNGSGTTAVLEMARLLALPGNRPNCTVRFIAFDAEESGLLGSLHYAGEAYQQNMNIGLMSNYDCIGSWLNDTLCASQPDSGSEVFAYLLCWSTEKYGNDGNDSMRAVIHGNGMSDNYSFQELGFPTTFSQEYNLNMDIIHSSHDSTTYINYPAMANIIRGGLGLMATVSNYPRTSQPVVIEVGSGTDLFVTWPPDTFGNVVAHKTYWGRSSGEYSDSVTTGYKESLISGLTADSLYYIGVVAIDDQDRPSPLINEVTATPRYATAPKAPSDLTATPIDSGIVVVWNRNYELDLAGYRIYRRTDSTEVYDSLNAGLTLDTTYTDKPLGGDNKYYYYVKAIDNDGNNSPGSDTIPGRPITMDQGILLVDETDDMPYGGATGDTSAETSQDSLYHYVLGDNQYREYEYNSGNSKPEYIDYTPYGMVIWVADDYSELLAWECLEGLKKYLDIGGRLLLAGWKPSMDLRDTFTYPYPVDFGAGTILYDYFHISHIDISTTVDSFLTAQGLLNYPGIPVDAAKYPVNTWGGTLRYVELLTPVAPAEGIYSADFKNDNSVHQNKVCGVRYLGDDYKTCYLGYPLYYMEKDQVKILIERVLDDFNGVQNDPLPVTYVAGLQQNAPNPFSQYTAISYQLEKPGLVNMKIYNIVGQVVKTLVHGEHLSGSYTVRWDGRDDKGFKVSNGVYVYKLEAAGIKGTKKMLLLR